VLDGSVLGVGVSGEGGDLTGMVGSDLTGMVMVDGDLTGMVDGDLAVVLGGGVRGDHAGDGLRQRGRVAA
jgi:hypothetical protein